MFLFVVNEIIILVKDIFLVYVLGLDELFKFGKIVVNRDVLLMLFVIVGVVYLIVIVVLS